MRSWLIVISAQVEVAKEMTSNATNSLNRKQLILVFFLQGEQSAKSVEPTRVESAELRAEIKLIFN